MYPDSSRKQSISLLHTLLTLVHKGGPGSGDFGHAGRPPLEGGSAPANSRLEGSSKQRPWSEEFETHLQDIENTQLQRSKKEAAFVISPDGTILHKLDGSKFLLNIPNAIHESLPGTVFTHTHIEETPVSSMDFHLLFVFDLQQIRAITPTHRYILAQPDPPFTDTEKIDIQHEFTNLVDDYLHEKNRGRELKSAKRLREMLEPIYTHLSKTTRLIYSKEPL